jgi:hypothetical protein
MRLTYNRLDWIDLKAAVLVLIPPANLKEVQTIVIQIDDALRNPANVWEDFIEVSFMPRHIKILDQVLETLTDPDL